MATIYDIVEFIAIMQTFDREVYNFLVWQSETFSKQREQISWFPILFLIYKLQSFEL